MIYKYIISYVMEVNVYHDMNAYHDIDKESYSSSRLHYSHGKLL